MRPIVITPPSPTCTYTLFTVIHLTVEVNFSSEIEIISGNNSSVCFNILFTWTPLFGADGASELLGKNVTACTWSRNISYSTPASHDAPQRTIHVDTNSTVARIILPIDPYSSLLPGTHYFLWLSVSAQLSNGTCTHFRSTVTELEIPTCGGGPEYSLHIITLPVYKQEFCL